MLAFVSIAVIAFIVVVGGFVAGDGHHDHDFSHGGDGDGTPSVFSLRVLGTFALGFGAAGAIATACGWPAGGASAIGAGCGGVLGFVTWAFLYALAAQQVSTLTATCELVGRAGVVTTALGPNGVGEVVVSRGETSAQYLARSRSGSAIAKGRPVRVVGTQGSLLFVDESTFSPQDELSREGGRT